MTARKTAARKAADKPMTAPPADAPAPIVAEDTADAQAPVVAEDEPAVDEQTNQNDDDGQELELAWCRIGRDLEEHAPECPRHEFEAGARLCNLHFVTRLDLREVARNDG